MKWCRVRTPDGPCFGMVEGETIALIDGTPFDGARKTGKTLPLAQSQLLVPVIPGTFYAIGSNYRDHIEKMAQAANRKPIYYDRPRVGYRANSALIAHDEDIVKPADSTELFQYEAELVAVIGKRGRNVTPEQAWDLIFGWTIGNDVSERTWQRSDPTNIRAKNCDTFKPMGPFILQGRDLRGMQTEVRLNGSQVHRFDTGNMIFSPAEVVSEISKYNTLSPGDVVWLGTDDKPHNLKVGDVLEIDITGIGMLRSKVVAEQSRR
ncbi:MAG: fumarylacetoacetate hydrolase family protein [Xanthobacteraceae bacterium]|nr:fumarylacetoacetate hydrolase family protein [Xanthobacteraceae bacterium]